MGKSQERTVEKLRLSSNFIKYKAQENIGMLGCEKSDGRNPNYGFLPSLFLFPLKKFSEVLVFSIQRNRSEN